MAIQNTSDFSLQIFGYVFHKKVGSDGLTSEFAPGFQILGPRIQLAQIQKTICDL